VVNEINSSPDAGTLSAWAKFDVVADEPNGGGRNILVMGDSGGGNGFIGLRQQGNVGADDFEFFYKKSGGNTVDAAITDTSLFDTGEWRHWVGVWDTSNIYFYIDGVLQASDTKSATESSLLDAGIGTLNCCALNDPFNGLIDDVRIYNRALSPTEIRRLYRLGGTAKIGVSNTSDKQLTNGLVGHWTFDAPDMAGDIAYDVATTSNDGTLTNGPTRTIGRIGQALEFDGTNDFVDIDGVVTSMRGTEGAISAWAKFDLVRNLGNGTNRHVLATTNTGGGNGFVFLGQVGVNGNDLFGFRYRVGGGNAKAAEITDTTPFDDGTWRHWVGVWDATNLYFYVDGELQASNTKSGTETGHNAGAIGSNGAGSASYFEGLIDDVRIYNRILSENEVRRLYNMGL
jgi:hypothetical protein